jgi:uncharacterized membrane protein YhaH (DUF805 family)
VIFWPALLFLCVGWIVFYVNTITKNATSVASPALTGYILICGFLFAVALTVVLTHNFSVYPKRFAEWDRSFICQRCAAISEQNLHGLPVS